MTRRILGSSRPLPKDQIPQPSTNRNSNHNPSIIRHENKPNPHQPYPLPQDQEQEDLHNHKSIEILKPIQHRLDDMRPVRDGDLVLPWQPQRGCFSIWFDDGFFFAPILAQLHGAEKRWDGMGWGTYEGRSRRV